MELNATGEPVVAHDEIQVHVGINLQQGSLVLTRDGKNFSVYHAQVLLVSALGSPWIADEVKFTAEDLDGKTVALTVNLLNDTYDGPRAGVPASVWKVVSLAATSAGDIGITYTHPGN